MKLIHRSSPLYLSWIGCVHLLAVAAFRREVVLLASFAALEIIAAQDFQVELVVSTAAIPVYCTSRDSTISFAYLYLMS
jgi:hypothetical protein